MKYEHINVNAVELLVCITGMALLVINVVRNLICTESHTMWYTQMIKQDGYFL